jgi:hypothetical protein
MENTFEALLHTFQSVIILDAEYIFSFFYKKSILNPIIIVENI